MLYQDKYLIAVYNNKDEFIDCQTSIEAFKKPHPRTIRLLLKHKKLPSKYKVYLIDCTETHDDVFAEEDEIFLQEENTKTTTKKEQLALYGKQHGISLRTAWRWFAKGKIKPKDLEGFKSVI